jgi:hypothetical protein
MQIKFIVAMALAATNHAPGRAATTINAAYSDTPGLPGYRTLLLSATTDRRHHGLHFG